MQDKIGKRIADTRAWRGAELATESDWVTYLSAKQISCLEAVADALPENSEDWPQLDTQTVTHTHQAEVLAEMLVNASTELASGKGFVLLRGLEAFDAECLRRAFWVIGRGLGEPVMQNAKGEIFSIIADRFAGAERGVDTRGYESNDELRFHCDGGDCIGMSCVRQAPQGGTNGLVSLFTIYNEILSHHPEHLDVLIQGYRLYARKEKGDAESTKKLGKVQQKRIPVFAWHEGRMSTWLNIQLAELAAQVSGRDMIDAEREALACVEAVALQPDMQLMFRQQPGDVLFVNNLAVMHRREKYHDAPGKHKERMLYRMWINLHESQPVVAQHSALRHGIRGPKPIIAA